MGRRAPGTRRGRVAPVVVFAVVFALAAQDAHSQSKNTKKSRPARFFSERTQDGLPNSICFFCMPAFFAPKQPKVA